MVRSPGVIILSILMAGLAIAILLIAPFSEQCSFRQSLVAALGLLFLAPPLAALLVFRRPRQAFVSLIACFSAYIFSIGLLTLSYSLSVTILASGAAAATAVAAETLLLKGRPIGAIVNLIAGAGFVFLLGGVITNAYSWAHGVVGACALWVIAGAVALILNARPEKPAMLTDFSLRGNPR